MRSRRGHAALNGHVSNPGLGKSSVRHRWLAPGAMAIRLTPAAMALSMVVACTLLPAGLAAAPTIRPGAVEIGLSGAVTVVEGSSRGSAAVDGSFFLRVPGGLACGGLEVAYAHVRSLDLLDLGAQLAWTRAAGATSLYPFIALVGALRQEWIGSFAETRYPVGVDLGIRALVAASVNVRVQYRIQRVLSDPVADYTEQELRVGVAVLLRNTPPQ